MRHPVGYVLTQTQAIIEFDREEFEKVTQNRVEKYEYIQTFEDNNIYEYNTIVVHCKHNSAIARVKEVGDIYGLVPQEVRSYEGDEDYIFYLQKPMNRLAVHKMAKVLEELYNTEIRFMTFFAPKERHINNDGFLNVSVVQQIGIWINKSNNIPINDIRNRDSLILASAMDPKIVMEKLKRFERIDSRAKIIIGYGGVLDLVLAHLRSTDATYKFFSEHFDIPFEDAYESMDSYMNDGIGISSEGVVQDGNRLLIIDDRGNSKELTDFLITVHYKIRRSSGISYIVSLLKDDIEVKHIEWPMTFSEQKVSEFISGLGPFHISSSKSNLKKLHEMISTARVPDITVYYKYGRAKYGQDDIVLFKDYVYNLTKGAVIPKLQGSSFYFVDGINGIKVEGVNGIDIDSMLVDKAPSLGNAITKSYEDIENIVKSVFVDESGDVMCMTACTWLGHMIFPTEYSCPLFFTTGITGSGKTTYAKYLCAMFGIKKPLSIEGTTPFPLRISLTLLEQLPLFLNEFRTKMQGASEKTSILKSLFDGTAFERGKKDLSLESHRFSAYVFMEGEELPQSGATRSRSIVWKIKKSGQGKVSAENILQDNRETLSSFIYSYIKNADRTIYMKKIDEAMELFDRPGMDKRILTNVALMFAASCAFAPDKENHFVSVCKKILETQMKDFEQNGTVAEIINIIGKYLSSRYAKVYVDGYSAVIAWNDLVDFCEKGRLTTELKLESYRDHIEAFGIEQGFMEVENDDVFNKGAMMVDGLRIQIAGIDKRFLGNPTVYNLYKQYNNIGKK